MVAGGLIAAAVSPAAFDILPASYTWQRAALGGLLIGLGSALGNGCTSGHGICECSTAPAATLKVPVYSLPEGR